MKWLRRKEVAAKLGISESHLRTNVEKMPGFPQAINLSPMVIVYDEAKLEAWMTSLVEPVNTEAQEVAA